MANAHVESFKSLNLNEWLLQRCRSLGLYHPTPVQHHCIPPILNGEDCIGCAKTGSGKTLAFCLPILQKLSEDPYGIFALVLTPTRELAFQIAEQFQVLGKPIGLKVCVIVGGMDMVIQGKELQSIPHVVISTPGRLADHLESCDTFTLKKIKFLVLDEADRLLEGAFNEQLEIIFSALSKRRQTLLFSATMPQALEEVKNITLNKPFCWSSPSDTATVDQLKQYYILTPPEVKDAYLISVIHQFGKKSPKGSVIIFTKTCRDCQIISMTLTSLGFDNVALHSMITQKERFASLSRFKSNTVTILVATDVASRGLDIPEVDMVFNRNIPAVPKDYVHRVGRTARAGKGGVAVTLVTQYDIELLHSVENLINTKLVSYSVQEKEVLKILTQVSVAKREAEIRLENMDFGQKRQINKKKKLILEGKDPDDDEQKQLKRKQKKRLKVHKQHNKVLKTKL